MERIRTSRAGSESGYTLTELLVVLAITLLIVGITPALYRTVVPAAQLKSNAVSLLGYLRAQQLTALRSGQAISLQIHAHHIGDRRRNQTGFDLAAPAELSYQPSFFDSDRAGADLTFYPDGTSSGGIVTLQRGHSHQTIEINWLTGRTAISP